MSVSQLPMILKTSSNSFENPTLLLFNAVEIAHQLCIITYVRYIIYCWSWIYFLNCPKLCHVWVTFY